MRCSAPSGSAAPSPRRIASAPRRGSEPCSDPGPIASLAVGAPAGLEVEYLEQRVIAVERVVQVEDLGLDRLHRAAQQLPLGVLVAHDAEHGLPLYHRLGGEGPR